MILLFLTNLIVHYWHKNRIGNFLNVFYRLNKLTKCGRQIHKLHRYKQNEIIKNIKNIEQLSANISFLKTDNLKENEIGMIVWYFIELIKILTLSEVTFFHKVLQQINDRRTDIHALYAFIGRIDQCVSIGFLRNDLPFYCCPKFTHNKKQIKLESIYHPLVKDCISNDFNLQEKSLLLTGSNMSGKSTFIKSVSLNIIASQTLNTSFAKSSINPNYALSTSIRITDNIEEGASYYMEEVRTIGEMINQSNEDSVQYLFIIDEVFKGTNTIERVSAGKSILSYLNRKNHIVLVSTHDIELANLLEEEYDLKYFQESIDDGNLMFDYKIKTGKLKNKNAINILEAKGYPSSIINEAESLAEQFEAEKIKNNN